MRPSTTGGSTCTPSARGRRRTRSSSGREGTRRTSTRCRSAGTAAGWRSRPPRARLPATTSGWPTWLPRRPARPRCAWSRKAWTRGPASMSAGTAGCYVFTDAGAPRGRLAVADPGRPDRPGWQDLIGEDPEAVLQDYAVLDGGQARPPLLLATWTRHAFSEITVHDLASGERRGAITVPGPDAAGNRPARHHQPDHRAAGGRARSMVRLHRSQHAGHHLPLMTPAPARSRRGRVRLARCGSRRSVPSR